MPNKSSEGRLVDFIKLARPHQYLKNGFIFLPLIFGWKLFDPDAVVSTILAFIGFCMVASMIYVFNDVLDAEEDRTHPVKRHRPLAAGRIQKRRALWFAGFLGLAGLGISLTLKDRGYLCILLAYVLINAAYTLKLKHWAVIDVVTVALGFVLRVFAGAVVIDIRPSHWLVLMTFLLALFISMAKRRDDLLLADSDNAERKSLDGYTLEFVSAAMVMLAAVTIVSYILYTVSPVVIEKHGTPHLYLTSFWVIVGVLRYMQITFVLKKSGSPTQVLLKDVFLQVVVGLWLLSCVAIIYMARF